MASEYTFCSSRRIRLPTEQVNLHGGARMGIMNELE
jgi:hypothetical protein